MTKLLCMKFSKNKFKQYKEKHFQVRNIVWPSAGMAAQLSLLRHLAAMLTFPVCVCGGGHARLCNSYQARDIFSLLIPEYIW